LAVSEALSGPPVATVVRSACDSLSTHDVSEVLSPDDSRTDRNVLPAEPSPSPDAARPVEYGADDVVLIGTDRALDMHAVPRPGSGPDCYVRDRPPCVASSGSEVSRCGLSKNGLVQLCLCNQLLQTSILSLKLFQSLRLIRANPAIFLPPAVIRVIRYADLTAGVLKHSCPETAIPPPLEASE